MSEKHALVFANGELVNPKSAISMAANADLLIAADGGLTHMQALGFVPDLLIGDLDSVTDDQVNWAQSKGARVMKFPMDKDETDLELALHEAVNSGCKRITITAAMGGRFDQTLSNIYLLNLPVLNGIDARIDDGLQEVILVRRAAEVCGTPGDIISLLPLSPIVRGITTNGLKYPLADESLIFYRSRGLSNVMLTDQASVSIVDGVLLCVHQRLREIE